MPTVSQFLCERLENSGLKHIFGSNGFYIDSFLKVVEQSEKISFIRNMDDNYSGFAADAYARSKGIGCVCATYNTGALKLCNAIAGAYAERSPIVVIAGSPGIKDRDNNFSSNHLVESFNSQKEIFDHITSHSVVLNDPTTAGWHIDNAFNILKESKQPIYIELPKDVATQPIKYDVYTQGTPDNQKSDLSILKESIEDVSSLVLKSKNPVLVVGVQITRFNLEDALIKFAEKHSIPIVTTLLSKSSVSEDHPLFCGVYLGDQTKNEKVKDLVDSSDCLLIFGELITDMAFRFITPKFDYNNTIFCSVENFRVRNHIYCNVRFVDFCKSFFKLELDKKFFEPIPKVVRNKFLPQNKNLSLKRLLEKIDSLLSSNFIVLTDLDEASDLVVFHHAFISSSFYRSMGLCLPGAVGAQLSNPNMRPLVLINEDSFRSSIIEINTIFKNNLNPIIFVIKKEIKDWNYTKVCDMIGGGRSYDARDEEELEGIIENCLLNKEFSIINVFLES